MEKKETGIIKYKLIQGFGRFLKKNLYGIGGVASLDMVQNN